MTCDRDNCNSRSGVGLGKLASGRQKQNVRGIWEVKRVTFARPSNSQSRIVTCQFSGVEA